MKGILALFGSGEFTKAMVPVDTFLLNKTKDPKIAILPTAAGQEKDYKKWIADGEIYYKDLGFDAHGFDIITRQDADSENYAKELANYNYIVFSGGDPGYLLDTMRGSLVWKTIFNLYERGSTLIGSSAGAMVFGKKTWARVYEFEKTGEVKSWEDGLGLVEFGVIPHFDFIKRQFNGQKLDKIRKSLPKDTKIIGIDENTAYIQVDGKWSTNGIGKVYVPANF